MRSWEMLRISLFLSALLCLTAGCGDDASNGKGGDKGNSKSPAKSADDKSADEKKDSDKSSDAAKSSDTEQLSDNGAPSKTSDDGAATGDSGIESTQLVSTDAGSQDRGNLIVQFVFDGTSPEAEKIVPSGADADYCSDNDLVKEDLVIDPDTNGIANVVGWLTVKRGEDPPAAPPGNDEAKKEPVVLDNIGCRFEPHMVLVQTGQTLIVRNSDQIGHNAKANLLKNADKAFSDNLPAGRENKYMFDNAESLPMIVECTAHPWMRARLFILDHPYFAKSDKTGKLVIKDLPVGEVTIRFNHELAGNLRAISIGGEETSRRGEVTITIKPGDNDLGVVKLAPSTFE